MKTKKAQIAIFIILGLMILVVILLFFLIKKPKELQVIDDQDPQSYIDSCTKEATLEAIKILSKHGGDIVPKGSTMFESINITYHCYADDYYNRCVNQRPLLIKHIEQEITNYITPIISNCFDRLNKGLGKRYNIEMKKMQVNTNLYPKKISVDVSRHFRMQRDEEVRTYENFDTDIITPTYDLARTAIDITNEEARSCFFDILGYMVYHPEYSIDKYRPGNSDIIYKIKDRDSGQEFFLAIRSCALPPGF